MKALWPIYHVHADGRKFAYEEYTVDHDERFTKGRKTLPDCEGGYPYPYTIEFARYVAPKLVDGDDLKDIIHNMMVFYSGEEMETLGELKERAKNGMEAYPNHFMYRFTLAAINLVTNEMAAWCNEFGRDVFEYPLPKESLVDVAVLMATREGLGLPADVVTKVVKEMLNGMSYADAFEKSLPAMVVEGELEGLVREALKEYPEKVADWKKLVAKEATTDSEDKTKELHKRKTSIVNMIVGMVMRKKKGLDAREVVKAIEVELSRDPLAEST